MKFFNKIKKTLSNNTTKDAQYSILEDIFNDLYPKRWTVYKVNFFRGIFFGFGSAIGATLLFLALIWFLNLFVNIPGGIGDFIQKIITAMNSRR